VVPRVTALRELVTLRFALKIRARHVVEKHFVLTGKELPVALGQIRFERALVHKQLIERSIQPLLFIELWSFSFRMD